MAVAAGHPPKPPRAILAKPNSFPSSDDADGDSFRSRLLGFLMNDTCATRKAGAGASVNNGIRIGGGGGRDNRLVPQRANYSTKGDGDENDDAELREFRAKMLDRYRSAVDNIQRAYAPAPAKRDHREGFRCQPTAEVEPGRRRWRTKIGALPAVERIGKGYKLTTTTKPQSPPAVTLPSNYPEDAKAPGPAVASSSPQTAGARAGPADVATPPPPSKPWNLRKRKPTFSLDQALAANQQHQQIEGESAARMSLGVEVTPSGRLDKKLKPTTLLATLTKEEIYSDFLLMTGAPPPRRPKKLPRKVRDHMQTLYPELSSPCITSELYMVPEDRKQRR